MLKYISITVIFHHYFEPYLSFVNSFPCRSDCMFFWIQVSLHIFHYSPVRSRSENVSVYISDVSRNSSRHIISAGVTKMTYFIKRNDTLDTSKGRWVCIEWGTFSSDNMAWEMLFQWSRSFVTSNQILLIIWFLHFHYHLKNTIIIVGFK